MAWSFSALESWETCPRKHFRTRIAKDVPDPPGEAAEWGNRVHKVLENRLKGDEPIVGVMAPFESYASRVIAAPGRLYAEQKIALTRDLKKTKWFAKDVWVRGVIDAAKDAGRRVLLIDWKTGKRKQSQQLALTAAMGCAIFPKAETFDTAFVWFKEKAIDREQYSRDEAFAVWDKFIPRVERMEQAIKSGEFEPRPSGLCRGWCPVKDCEYNGS